MVEVSGDAHMTHFGNYGYSEAGDGFNINLFGLFNGRFDNFQGGGGFNFNFETPVGDFYGGGAGPVGRGYAAEDWSFFIDYNTPGYDFTISILRDMASVYHLLHPRSMFYLEGDNRDFPGGNFEVLYFPSFVYDLPEGVENYNPTFLVKACYDYVTIASPVMCIDPQPHSNAEKVCTPHTVHLSGGQGAPVAVTKVEQISSPSKIVFYNSC
jgi:hypothetical protein